jgi:hypothetical protein
MEPLASGRKAEKRDSLLSHLDEGIAPVAAPDPWMRVLQRALPVRIQVISTVTLCDLIGVAPTSGNMKRIARSMLELGFIPIKSRNLVPGSNRGTMCRGWRKQGLPKSGPGGPRKYPR